MRLDSMKNIKEEKILRATKSYPEYFGIDILLKVLNKFGKICEKTVRRDMEEHYRAYIKVNNLYYFKKNEIIDCFKSDFNKRCDECIFDCKNISFDEIILENRELFRKELSDLELEELISNLAVEHFSDINFKHTF